MKNSILSPLVFCLFPLLSFAEKDVFEIEPSLTLIEDFEYFSQNHFGDNTGEVQANLRRARFGLSAKILDQLIFDKISFKFSAQYDEDDNQGELRDLYLKFTTLDDLKFTLGRFNEPLGMESQLSIKWQTFHERSIATNAFFFGRQDGLLVEDTYDNLTINLGFFLMDNEQSDDITPAITANLSHYSNPFSLFKLHWGFGGSHRDAFSDTTRLEADFLSRNSGKEIRSQRLDATELTLFRQEVALATKVFSLRAEFFQQNVMTTAREQREFGGFYASASWNFIGNGYAYKNNVFQLKKRKKVSMEAAIRYSEVDFEWQGEGDEGSSLNLTLNVYWSNRYKASLEYEHGEIVEFDEGIGSALQDEAIKLRMQLYLK